MKTRVFALAVLCCSVLAEPVRFGNMDPDTLLYTYKGVDSLVSVVRDEIPDVSSFVTESVTNGLASEEWVDGRGYLTAEATNGVARVYDVEEATNSVVSFVLSRGYATESVTNGLASEDWVLSKKYAPESFTNGVVYLSDVEAATNSVVSFVLSNNYVTASITNGLASEDWVLSNNYVTASITNGLASEDWVLSNNYVTASITNGLAFTNDLVDFATMEWVENKEYVTESVTNGLATEEFVTDYVIGHHNIELESDFPYIDMQVSDSYPYTESLFIYPQYTRRRSDNGSVYTIQYPLDVTNDVTLTYPDEGGVFATTNWVGAFYRTNETLLKEWVLDSAYSSTNWVLDLLDERAYVDESVTNGLASEAWALDKFSELKEEKDPTIGLTNSTLWVHGSSIGLIGLGENSSFTVGERKQGSAIGRYSVAFGRPNAWTNQSTHDVVVYAAGPQASHKGSIAIGNLASAENYGAIAIANDWGDSTRMTNVASGIDSIAIGSNVHAKNDYSIAIGSYSGYQTKAYGYNTMALHGGMATYDGAFAAGPGAEASGQRSVAIGISADAVGYQSICLSSDHSHADHSYSVAIGYAAYANKSYSIAMGNYAHANHLYSFAWNFDLYHDYYSNKEGSFNINPKNGLDGFYIGTNSLQTVLNDYKQQVKQELKQAVLANVSTNMPTTQAETQTILHDLITTIVNF